MNKKGFTLIELTVVVAVIAILAGGIFVAIDPARRLHESRNSRRSTDITTVLDALKGYQADNQGNQFSTVNAMDPGLTYQIGTDTSNCVFDCFGASTEPQCVDLTAIGTNYLAKVPYDPTEGSDQFTQYAIRKDSNGALTVIACMAEGEGAGGNGAAPNLSVTR